MLLTTSFIPAHGSQDRAHSPEIACRSCVEQPVVTDSGVWDLENLRFRLFLVLPPCWHSLRVRTGMRTLFFGDGVAVSDIAMSSSSLLLIFLTLWTPLLVAQEQVDAKPKKSGSGPIDYLLNYLNMAGTRSRRNLCR